MEPEGAREGVPYCILWDGECALCRRAVAWVRRRDVHGQFRAVAYQEVPGGDDADAVRVIGPDGVVQGGRAVLLILERLGWEWLARALGRRPWIGCVEWGYRLVARHRRVVSRLLEGLCRRGVV
ncbi:MAG: DCC1-like thiol-disulfide oxidoreductase family protein [Chloroherpetonaceae bacterium]|nr:DUF393 domain-containing protein [Chthonomonadaceae bacterium]MDW8206937.1 DCC1-like thiol-disulfide oxidoreductase family protein [Chloroherpetonaceae bacterium]